MNIGDVEENYKYAKVVQKTWKIYCILYKKLIKCIKEANID